jgi:uncharacterized protein YxeA
MKKVILSILGLALVAGCSGYDYYKTNVRYRQEGDNCVYYYTEKGKEFSSEIRNLKDAKKIVYNNVRCEDLYLNDTYGAQRYDRKAIVPAATEEPVVAPAKCGCKTCAKKQVLKNRYVIVPAYAG